MLMYSSPDKTWDSCSLQRTNFIEIRTLSKFVSCHCTLVSCLSALSRNITSFLSFYLVDSREILAGDILSPSRTAGKVPPAKRLENGALAQMFNFDKYRVHCWIAAIDLIRACATVDIKCALTGKKTFHSGSLLSVRTATDIPSAFKDFISEWHIIVVCLHT